MCAGAVAPGKWRRGVAGLSARGPEDGGRLAGPVEGQGGEVAPLLTEHIGGVLNEDPDHHGAQEPGHSSGAGTLIQVGAIARDPVLNGGLEGADYEWRTKLYI